MDDPAISTADRLAVHELLALHGHLADDHRSEDLPLLLTSDAVYDLREFGLGMVEGISAVTDLHQRRPGNQPAGHHVTNIRIEEQAEGTMQVRSKGLSVMADGTAGTCTYEDRVVRTQAGWRIAQRRVIPARHSG